MALKLQRRRRRRTRVSIGPNDADWSRLVRKNAFFSRNSSGEGQCQSDLPAAGKFDIYLRQQLRIEQRAVFDAVGTVDAVTSAQRIERMLCSRVPRTGKDRKSVV